MHAHNHIIGPVVGPTLRPVHLARRSASDAQMSQKLCSARTGYPHFCASWHSTFDKRCITAANYFLSMCDLRADEARQLSFWVVLMRVSSVYNAHASLGHQKSFVFVAGIQGSKSSPSRHRLHAKSKISRRHTRPVDIGRPSQPQDANTDRLLRVHSAALAFSAGCLCWYPMGYDDKGGWIPEVGDERVVRNLVRT